MVKYKNKNLKITLSLVVSTMSIVMANCMEDQGSGSSSSNAPAASGSSSSNASTTTRHAQENFFTPLLLQYINDQNALEKTQSALGDTLAEVIERFDDRQLRLSNLAEVIERFDDRQLRLSNLAEVIERFDDRQLRLSNQWLDTLPELSRRLSQEIDEVREGFRELTHEQCLFSSKHKHVSERIDGVCSEITDLSCNNKRKHEDCYKAIAQQECEMRILGEKMTTLGNDLNRKMDASKRSRDEEIESLRRKIDRDISCGIEGVNNRITEEGDYHREQRDWERSRVDDELRALRLGRIDDRQSCSKEIRERINSFHQGRLKELFRNIYNENQRLAAENANLTQELVEQRVEFDRRLKALENRSEKGSTWFACLNGIFLR